MLRVTSLAATALALFLALGSFIGSACAQQAASPPIDASCTRPAGPPAPGSPGDVPDYRATAEELQDSEQRAAEADWQAYQLSIFDALSRSNDPRDLAIATMRGFLAFDSGSEQVQRYEALRARAVSAAPDDVLVQWIVSRAPAGSAAGAAAAQRLQHLEPENAVAWLDELRVAAQGKDRYGVDATLSKMSSASRFDLHYAELIKAVAETYLRVPTPPDVRMASSRDKPMTPEYTAFTQAAAVTAAIALPALQDLINACRAAPAQALARAPDCGRTGRMMAVHSDTVLGTRFGYVLLRVSRTFAAADVQLARNDDWVYERFLALDRDNPDPKPVDAELVYQKDWIESGSEMEAMRHKLAAEGVPATPPDEWTDDSGLFSAKRLQADAEWFARHPTE